MKIASARAAWLAGASLLAGFGAMPALAQGSILTQPRETAEVPRDSEGEILVTARRRSESLQLSLIHI